MSDPALAPLHTSNQRVTPFYLTRELFKLLFCILLYILGLILAFNSFRHNSLSLFFLSTLSFYGLSMFCLNYLLSLGSDTFRTKVKHNGYYYFLFWSILYLLSVPLTPVLIVFMIIRCVILASKTKEKARSTEPLISEIDD